MCWLGARLETLCSWKVREQKPAKEGGKGSEGEERKRRAGVRERGGGEVRSSDSTAGARDVPGSKTKRGGQVHPFRWLLGGVSTSLGGAGREAGHPGAQRPGQTTQGPFLPSLVLLFGDVRLKISKAFRGKNKGHHEVEGMAR